MHVVSLSFSQSISFKCIFDTFHWLQLLCVVGAIFAAFFAASSSADTMTQQQRKQLPTRSSRGTRINKLIGEEAEADETFWGQDAWREDDEDDDYSTEEGALSLLASTALSRVGWRDRTGLMVVLVCISRSLACSQRRKTLSTRTSMKKKIQTKTFMMETKMTTGGSDRRGGGRRCEPLAAASCVLSIGSHWVVSTDMGCAEWMCLSCLHASSSFCFSLS